MSKGTKSRPIAALKLSIAIALLSASFAVFTLQKAGNKLDNKAYSKPKTLVFKDLGRRFQDVRRVKITTPDGSFQFRKNSDNWQIMERGNYPLNALRLTEFANQLAGLAIIAVKSTDPADFDQLGVGEPLEFGFGSIIEFFDSQDQIIDASHIGQKPDGIYVRRMGDVKVHLVEGKLMEFTKINDWPDYKIFTVTPTQIKAITLGRAGVKLQKSFDNAKGEFQTSNTAQTLMGFVNAPKFNEIATHTRINAKPSLFLSYALMDGSVLRISIHGQYGNYWAKINAIGPNNMQNDFSKTINEKASQWAYSINKEQAAELLKAAY